MCLILNIAAYRRDDRVTEARISAGRSQVVLFTGVRYERYPQNVAEKPVRKPRTKSTSQKKAPRSP